MSIKPRLPHGWRCWVAENVLLGVSAEDIESRAEAAGIDRTAVRSEIEATRGDPYIVAGEWLAQKLKKLESIQQVHVELARQNASSATIPSFSRLSPREFREQFYAQNRPVKLLNMMDDWPALHTWSPEHFRAHYGDEEIEATTSRDADPKYEINLEQHRQKFRFRDFVDLVVSGAGNNSYLVANNHFFEQRGMAPLLDDLGPVPGYLKQSSRAAHTYLWFGPANTVTPLHHDTMNVLFGQIYGKKRILLIAPDETPWLYNEVAVYSEVQMDHPDLGRYPLFRHVAPLEVIVNPGEMLFIPVCWWHYVCSLDTSISVSFTNFEFPNEYHWQHPDIRRNS
jgi:ribosomal protein L16 Arg81 hydroxylase